MVRQESTFLIDVAIGVAFLVEAISGFVLWLVLPHGGYPGGRKLLYDETFILSRDSWLDLHDWFAVVMVAGILLHLVLHWRWIYAMFRCLWREAFSARTAQAHQNPEPAIEQAEVDGRYARG